MNLTLPLLSAFLLPLWTSAAAVPPSAPESKHKLSVDRIFSSSEFTTEGLGTFQWSKRSHSYFTLEAPKAGGSGKDLVRNDLASGAKEIVVAAHGFIPPGETTPMAFDGFDFSSDESRLLVFTKSKRVWRRNTRGDYWVLDISAREWKKLGGAAAPSTLMFAKFSPDGKQVAYVLENNLYTQDPRTLQITALTTQGSPTLMFGTSDWVYEEELDLRDAYRWSPDGKQIAFWQIDASGVREFFLINNTDGLYPSLKPIPYPKVGEQNSAARLGVVPAQGGELRWLEIPGDPRNHYPAQMEWTPDSSQLLVQQFNRLQNTNRVFLADANSGQARVIHTESDPAWLENENPVRWVKSGAQFAWLSERDGWRHAYLAAKQGGPLTQVTQGGFDVIQIEAVDEKSGWLYYAASPEEPTRRYLYRVPLAGGGSERVTPRDQPGWHTYDIAPGGGWAVHTSSTFMTPPVVELIRLPGHQVVRTLVSNETLRKKLAGLRLPVSEFLRVNIGGGVELDAWCLKPPGRLSTARHPLLFYVYGEPHGQTVRDAWQGSRGLWHMMLAQRGYVVASVDNRGVIAPRGREWRKVVHRQVGILASREQADATQKLLERWKFVDRRRVGIWGWSGGGSMTLNAMFRYPDLYHAGISVAPVPNMRLYDTIYQERYMGLPDDNVEGYRRGSPLHFASELRGDLLIVHGTGDDNCHYQGVEQLANELVAHHKPFTLMPYPNRSHSVSEGKNTTRHLHELMTRFFEEHLPVRETARR